MSLIKPQLTVITPSFNHAQYLEECIESVLKQSFKDFVYIILDDGSTDNSRDIIEAYAKKDKRILFITHENKINKGLAVSVESLVHKVETPYLAFIESDDIWQENFLAEMYALATKNNKVSLFYCEVQAFGDKQKRNDSHHKMQKRREKIARKTNQDRFDIWLRNPILTFSSVFGKSDLFKSCSYNRKESVLSFLDVFLWTQCFMKSPVIYYKKPLTLWRQHDLSYSNGAKFPPFFVEDMAFDNLYPESKIEDKILYKKLLNSPYLKHFRSQVKSFLSLYFKCKYGKKKIDLTMKTDIS